MDIIKSITEEQIRTDLPELKIGDTVKVYFKVREGSRERVQTMQTHPGNNLRVGRKR